MRIAVYSSNAHRYHPSTFLPLVLAMTSPDSPQGLSYKDAGVDIDAGNRLVELIKPHAQRTRRPEVLAGLGGFGGLFELPPHRYHAPVLVSGTDGVGTKLKLALDIGKHDTIGIDLVAMCVNDIVVSGAEPLFFLDYYATGKLEVEVAAEVIKGIADGCAQAGAALIGGETAEMPGMYQPGDYDLAGFCVGIVDKPKIIDGSRVQVGDALLGLASSGPHSNGYSLIRKVLAVSGAGHEQRLGDQTLGEHLLAPTTIYVKPLLSLIEICDVRALAHITGGGLTENIPRVLPKHADARIDLSSWQRPAIFSWLQARGGIDESEMLRTFNCGIGMVVALPDDQIELARQTLRTFGIEATRIGEIIAATGTQPAVRYQ